MPRPFTVIVIVVCVVAAFQVPAGGDTTRVKAAGSAGTYHWQPDFRHIIKGDKVVWKNPTSSPHTVTAYSNNWSKDTTIEANGGRTAKTFKKPGTYYFRCTQPGHSSLSGGDCSGMCGEIHVARR